MRPFAVSRGTPQCGPKTSSRSLRKMTGPCRRHDHYGCDQLIADPVEGMTEADRKKDDGIFRNSEIERAVIALGAPL
jgi:hypothetical protein